MIRRIAHCFTRYQDNYTKSPFALMVTYEDNSCVVLDPNTAVISPKLKSIYRI